MPLLKEAIFITEGTIGNPTLPTIGLAFLLNRDNPGVRILCKDISMVRKKHLLNHACQPLSEYDYK